MVAVQIIQANLAEIGIDVQINVHDSGTFWTLGSESDGESWKNIELIYARYSMAPDPSWATMWFTCDQVGVWNWERVCNEEFDDLHNKALGELDNDKRDVMYKKLQDMMEESGAYRFITHEATPAIYRDTIIPGVRPDGVPLLRHFRKA
jgi:peptide/nickel transport system substrate-binding protein